MPKIDSSTQSSRTKDNQLNDMDWDGTAAFNKMVKKLEDMEKAGKSKQEILKMFPEKIRRAMALFDKL